MCRKNAPLLDVHSNCSDDIFMSDVSVWWQIPQYMLVGIAEILIMVGGLDLFYSQVPTHRMHTVVAGCMDKCVCFEGA